MPSICQGGDLNSKSEGRNQHGPPPSKQRLPAARLSQYFFNHPCRFHLRQFLVQTLEGKIKLLVVNSELVQQRGVQISNSDRILGDVITEVIRFPIGHSALDPTPGKPTRKAARMMVPSLIRFLNPRD